MELPQPLAKLDLPRIDQVGYVVRDLAAAVARYEPLFGPFTRLDTPLTGVWYRGIPTDVHLSIAFGHTGDIEIEFIQPLSGASPHTEFLAAGREGIHHVRYRVPDANATIAALGTVGFDLPVGYARRVECLGISHEWKFSRGGDCRGHFCGFSMDKR